MSWESKHRSNMENQENVPRLRFSSFTKEWKEENLGDVARFSKGKGISKADIIENGKLECIRYGELYTHYGHTIDVVKSRTSVKPEVCVLSEANDVIIPASGESQLDIATAACVIRSGIALGGDLNIIKSSINGVFLAHYLNSRKKLEIAALAQGNSVVHLYPTQLKGLNVQIPTPHEQQKIAAFLTAVDDKIQQLSRKKELLEQYKKGVVQQLFTKKLRFKSNDGHEFPDWEEKTLGSICEKKSSNISASSLEGNHGNYVIYGATGVLKKVDFYREEQDYVSIVKDGAGVGRVLICEPKSSVLGTLDIIVNKPDANLYFLYACLGRIEFAKYIAGSTIPHIYFRDYSKEVLAVPCLEEQTKIATLLSAIDDKINQVNRQIEHTRQFKKGLLQQMFV